MPAEIVPAPPGRIVDANGFDYHVIEIGSGRPTFFLHGGGPGCTAWSDFGPVAPMFAADPRRCLLVDLLQYGKSSKCLITGPMWDFHARTINDLMSTLDIERADFVCNSWGGTIALNLAANAPERVRSLVVTGSMPVFYGPLAPLPEGGRRGRKARDVYFQGGPSWEKMKDLMATLEWYDRDEIPDATVTMRYEQSIDRDEMELAARSDSPRGEWQDMTAELARIRCPVLFAWGMHDAFLTPDYPLMLARMIEHGQLYIMDKASHHLQEERPQHFHSVVRGFLDQQERS